MNKHTLIDRLLTTQDPLLPEGNAPVALTVSDHGPCKHDLRISFIETRSFVWCAKHCGYKLYVDGAFKNEKN